ncbi:DcaP family trimeric outer membrane transporter [Sphingopyxis terrae]|uniref:DcaP family trimeric outer membrane transporter n=1 Tax=Sphingopyxis terrae TaxID=33052 RepID=UPI003F7F2525
MKRRIITPLHLLLAATALVAPGTAFAQSTPREAELEARLAKLEAEMQSLRADLASARSDQAATAAVAQEAAAKSDAAATKVAALQPQPAQAAPADGFRSGATTIKIGGFIKLTATNSRFSEGEVATNSLGRDFYLPQSIPVGYGPAARVQDFSAKQSRLWLNLSTDVAGHAVKGYVETDFQTSPGTQGSQRTTNGYNLALRRAYIQVDKFTFGQDWSTFQYVGALPESTDFVGATEGTVFVRQPLVRYSAPLGGGVTLHASIENAESGTATLGAPALVENGDDSIPDFAARIAYAGKLGELSLAGLAREVRVANAGVSAKNFGWGVSAAGKIYLAADKGSDIRFMATYGSNAGRYVGLNFAPDSVFDPATGTLADIREFAALAAVRLAVAPQLRVNLMGSYQNVDYAGSIPLATLSGFNDKAWSAAANLFWSPVKSIDLGIEYRHGEREIVSGAKGQLDRFEFAAKYSF